MAKLYYTISEVAEMLDETAVTVRYWTNCFPAKLSPKRNAKGNRLYMEKEIETLKKIKYLTRECGLSLDAVSKRLGKGGETDDKLLIIRDSLLRIRARLVQIGETL